jgi:hypothetical protein
MATLGPAHHALLMAWMAQEAVRVLGPIPAHDLLRDAVQRYGQERGSRMAHRATAWGHALDWTSYLAYKEWAAPDHPHSSETITTTPHWQTHVTQCPWNDAWEAEGLVASGGYYCRDIDRAIVQGFNPALSLAVGQTLPNEGACCEFAYTGYVLDADAEERLAALRADLGDSVVMPWSYHLGHLYWTVRRMFAEHTGAAGIAIAERALSTWEARFGAEAVDTIRAHEATDWTEPMQPDAAGH